MLHVILPAGAYVNDNASAATHDTSLITVSTDRIYAMPDVTVSTHANEENRVFVSFWDIAAHELADTFTIPAVISGAATTIEVSPLSYVKLVLDITEDPCYTEEVLNHWKQSIVALYSYYKATVAYRAELEAAD